MLRLARGTKIDQTTGQRAFGRRLQLVKLRQLGPFAMIHAVFQILDRAKRFRLRIRHHAAHKLHVRRHLRIRHRPAPRPRGEGLQQLFDICLAHRPRTIQCCVTARWPLINQRLKLQAIKAYVRSGVTHLEQHTRHLHRPGVIHFLRHRLAIGARLELRRIILFHQPLGPKIAVVRTVLPADPRRPGIINPHLGTERAPLAVTRQLPHLHDMRGRPADTAIAHIGQVQADLKRLTLVGLGQFIPRMFLVVAGHLHGHAIAPRSSHTAAQLARHQPTVAAFIIPLREQIGFLIKLLARYGLDRALAQLPALHKRRGEYARRGVRLRARVRGGRQRFFRGTQRELQQKIRHDQPVADVGKALIQFVLRKQPHRIVTLAFHAPVAVVVHQAAHRAGLIRRALQIEQIAQGVAQFETVQTADDRLATGTFALRVSQLKPRTEGIDKLGSIRTLRLHSFLGRHLAEIQLIQRILPNLQRSAVSEVCAERIETDFVLLLIRTVTLEAVRAQKRFQSIERLVRTRLAKRPDDGKQQEKRDAARAVHDFRSRPISVPELVPKRSASTPKFCSMDSSRFAAGTRWASSSG